MKPIILSRQAGFLLRVVDNGCKSHPYEWTIEGIVPKTKRLIRNNFTDGQKRSRLRRHLRPLKPRYSDDPEIAQYYRKKRLGQRMKRIYDPTSMPTSRGNCSALDYGIDEIVFLLNPETSRISLSVLLNRRINLEWNR